MKKTDEMHSEWPTTLGMLLGGSSQADSG